MAHPDVSDDPPRPPDPTRLIELITAYWSSMVPLAAHHLGLFSILSERARTADEVAEASGSEPRATAMLLNAAVGQGLVVKSGDGFANTPLAEAFLVPGKPSYLGDGLEYAFDLVPVWARLPDAVRSGEPPVEPHTILGGDPQKTRHFVKAMHNRASGVARSLAESLDLAGRRRLLDVGGGPGTYSIHLARKTPGLRSVVLDLPAVVEIAAEIIAESGSSDRVETLAGDYYETPFPEGVDVVLMSGMFHRETAEGCNRLLAKAFAALEEDGMIVVSDVFFDREDKTSPPFAALFALNMMLTSDDGGAHAETEVADWMRAAGFVAVEAEKLPPPMPHSFLRGRRPPAH